MASTDPRLQSDRVRPGSHKQQSESFARNTCADVDLSRHQCGCQYQDSNCFSYTSPLTVDFCDRLRALYVANSTSAVDRYRWQKLVESLERTPSTSWHPHCSHHHHHHHHHYHLHKRPQTVPLPQSVNDQRRDRLAATPTSVVVNTSTCDVGRPRYPSTSSPRLQHRPHTSMAVVVDRDVTDKVPAVCNGGGDVYETSYSKEFNSLDADIIPTISDRPATTVGAVFRMPSNKRAKQTTTYNDEYNVRRDIQQSSRSKPIYPPNGEKRNNPHPLQTFMIWRLPRSNTTCDNGNQADLIEEQFVKAMREGSNSTYKADYKNLTKKEIRELMKLSINKPVPQNTHNSTTRCHFRTPPPLSSVAPQLSVPTTRYASNPNRLHPAKGAVPGLFTSTDDVKEKEQANA